MNVKSEVKEILEIVKTQKLDIAKMTAESLVQLALDNEINLQDDDAEVIYINAVAKNLKVIYAKKDGMIHVIKENGKSNDLWYKYRDLEYNCISVFEYKKCFFSNERNNRAAKKCEFVRKYANPSIEVTIEKFKGGNNE